MIRWVALFGAGMLMSGCFISDLVNGGNDRTDEDQDDDDDDDVNTGNGGGGLVPGGGNGTGNGNGNGNGNGTGGGNYANDCELGAAAVCFCLQEYSTYECTQGEFDDLVAGCLANEPDADFVECYSDFVTEAYSIDCTGAAEYCFDDDYGPTPP